MGMYRIPRRRYLRTSKLARTRHSEKMTDFVDTVAAALSGTGASKNFTIPAHSYGDPATAVLTFTASPADGDTITIDSEVYTFGTGGIETIVNVTATGVLTATGNPANADTVTVGAKTYTIKTALSTGPTVANEILRGANTAATLSNLAAAITGGSGIGTLYSTGTTANSAIATAVADATTITLTAAVTGVSSVATTETSSVLSFAHTTLHGGIDEDIPTTVTNFLTALEDSLIVTGALTGSNEVTITTIQYLDLAYVVETSDTFASWATETTVGGYDPTNKIGISSHGYSVGDGPFVLSTNGTLPGGLATDTFYYVNEVVSSSVVKLSTDRNGDAAAITDGGSGTKVITKAESADAIYEAIRINGANAVATATDVDDL